MLSFILILYPNLLPEFDRARKHLERIVSSLPTHITSMSFSTYQLVQLVAINLFAMHHCKRKLHVEDNDTLIEEILGKEELVGYNMVLSFTGNTHCKSTSSIKDFRWC